MKEMLKNKYIKCGLFFLVLYYLIDFYGLIVDYFVMKNPNAYLDCGVRRHQYFDTYEKRSSKFRLGAYSISQCRVGKLLYKNYLALTDYESGYIYRALPLNLSEREMHFSDSDGDALTIRIYFISDPDGKETTFCFYRPIPWVYSENFKETKEEFIAKYNKKLEKLDKRDCF
ncbi:hypothetical protein BKK49_09795 [Rodentibacter rarus]|uniref:hypothetical protein n=1 Tax=Rodentibacter rarus TaxID=1908260 RepID=UPI000984244E|nr:hypothetical protein [Rodentibacter rarus]OOF38389.1 hypothetical protein BKK49_09795 [Rodentibacter rarus]